MILLLPLYGLVLLVGPHHTRSWAAIDFGFGFLVVFGLGLLLDLGRLRRGAFARFRPGSVLAEYAAVTAACGAFGVGGGLHSGTMLLLTCMPFMTIPVVGNRAMIGLAWLGLVGALGVETGLLVGRGTAVETTLLFAGTSAIFAAMIHLVVRSTVRTIESNRSLAALAATSGTLREWPGDLLPMAGKLAEAMGVASYAVLTRRDPVEPVERVFGWPDLDWPPFPELGNLPRRALETGEAAGNGRLRAVPAQAGPVEVVVITPERSTLGIPVDANVTATVASLLAAMADRARLVAGLVDLANTDELTGVANRRRLFETLAGELARARRHHRPLSLAMIDLDHFKAFNDRHGHGAGDRRLRELGRQLRERTRAQDLPARYGGEEFAVVLPETDTEGALHLVDLIRIETGADRSHGEPLTFSAGVATWDGQETPEELLGRADAALYSAKDQGRNRVVGAEATAGTPGGPGSGGPGASPG